MEEVSLTKVVLVCKVCMYSFFKCLAQTFLPVTLAKILYNANNRNLGIFGSLDPAKTVGFILVKSGYRNYLSRVLP